MKHEREMWTTQHGKTRMRCKLCVFSQPRPRGVRHRALLFATKVEAYTWWDDHEKSEQHRMNRKNLLMADAVARALDDEGP